VSLSALARPSAKSLRRGFQVHGSMVQGCLPGAIPGVSPLCWGEIACLQPLNREPLNLEPRCETPFAAALATAREGHPRYLSPKDMPPGGPCGVLLRGQSERGGSSHVEENSNPQR